MLKQLSIKNFALIEELEASFSSGMTCITGETGAGKSILLGGLSLVLGKRADLSSLQDPTRKCVVEASFDLSDHSLQPLFDSLEVDYDSFTVLRREILPQGKSRAFVNDTPVTLSVLEQISEHLIDLHSQNQTSNLLENEYQFEVLDALGKNKIPLQQYQETLAQYKSSMKQYEVLKLEAETSKASFELDEFLYRELLDLNLKEGMQEDLEQRHDSLSHVKYLQSNFTEGIQIMENESVGVIDQLLKLKSLASGLATKSTQFSSLEERFNTLFIEAQDLLEECKNQYEALETNPEELEKLESRLDELNTKMLKHKVGSVTELLDVQHQLEVRLKKTSNLETELTELKLRAGEYEKSLHQLGAQLTHRRKQAIEILEKELCDLVSKMGMNEAVFRIDLETQKTFKSNGLDQLNFLFKSNKSSDFKPLKKIASGGELSRIMLSVKAILSNYIKLPTLIFDEIDTGVSGKISDSIAEVMVSMSEKLQVINITHLPQVAAKSHYHFKVKKHQEDQKTVTQLVPLDKASRIEEIALMLSGNKVSATAIAHAKQLMN